jgi:hypothetical protein
LAKVYACGKRTNREQQAVFFNVVESVEHPEGIIPTFVWFESVDSIDRILGRALYFFAFSGFVFRGAVCNWEVDPMRAWRPVPGVTANNLVGQMVERTHQILNGIPRDERQALGVGSTLVT